MEDDLGKTVEAGRWRRSMPGGAERDIWERQAVGRRGRGGVLLAPVLRSLVTAASPAEEGTGLELVEVRPL